MLRRLIPGAVLPVLVLALSGCGGNKASATDDESAATMVPASTPIFVSVDTDTSSDELKSADALLKKFPARAQLLREVRASAREDGIDLHTATRSIGPETDIAVLDVKQGAVVGFTKPRDEEAFDKLLESGDDPSVHKKVGDWTVFSDEQKYLDLVDEVDRKLSDEPDFKAAMSSLPATAIAKAFVARSAIEEGLKGLKDASGASGSTAGFDQADWISAATFAHDDGMELQVNAHGKRAVAATTTYKATYTDLIPSDALLAVSFNGAGNQVKQLESGSVPQLKQVEGVLGVKLADIAEVFSGEGALYVRAGNPIPEVTIVAEESDEAKAKRTIDRLVAKIARNAIEPTPRTVDGVELQQLSLGPVSILYGTFDGKLVVTDDAGAIRELKSPGDRLADSATFKEAREAAGLPDETTGWAYVNLKDAVPVVESLSGFAGGGLPADIDANLKPLRSLLTYGKTDGDLASAVLFLQTN